MKQKYIKWRFQKKTLEKINLATRIIDEYRQQNLKLTVRQLYYQFVARGWLPNKKNEYENLADTIKLARLAGLIDWDAIEDRTRNLVFNEHWDDPGGIIADACEWFQLDHWADQPYRLEVWIEKEALTGVISQICSQLDVPYLACLGYVSISEMRKGAQRMRRYEQCGQQTQILHLGDLDPAGLDMTRDIRERFELFGAKTEIKRIALNIDQINEFDPPPDNVKIGDKKYKEYVAEFGPYVWELDALEPAILKGLIEIHINEVRDEEIYARVLEKESEYIRKLKHIEESWETLQKPSKFKRRR
jgi:hypothetical protein